MTKFDSIHRCVMVPEMTKGVGMDSNPFQPRPHVTIGVFEKLLFERTTNDHFKDLTPKVVICYLLAVVAEAYNICSKPKDGCKGKEWKRCHYEEDKHTDDCSWSYIGELTSTHDS